MTVYDRSDSAGLERTLETDTACSWIAHPDEEGQRASHALKTEQGVWVIDPLDAPGTDELIESLGAVAGVAVLSSWHARDAGAFARRYDVSVHIPEWMDRVEQRVDAPVEQYPLAPENPGQGLYTIPCRPFPLWQEVFLYHEPTKTLITPDSLAAAPLALLDGERLGLPVPRRLQPPLQLRGLEPDRILVGHGSPVTEDATMALETALDDSRSTFSEAVRENGADSLKSLLGVLF